MHGVLCSSLAHRSQGVDITKHIGERHHPIDNPCIAPSVHSGYLTATAVQVAYDVAHILLWRDYFDAHNRLEEFRASLHNAFLEGSAGCNLEGEHARVYVVMGSVDQQDL